MPTKTEEIFSLSCPYNNPYQGEDFKALFVCSAGLLRSATAANLFAKKGWNTRSCGSADYALIPISANLIAWADRIYFMKASNLLDSKETFKNYEGMLNLLAKKSRVLDIPDNFEYNNKDLVLFLEERVKQQ